MGQDCSTEVSSHLLSVSPEATAPIRDEAREREEKVGVLLLVEGRWLKGEGMKGPVRG